MFIIYRGGTVRSHYLFWKLHNPLFIASKVTQPPYYLSNFYTTPLQKYAHIHTPTPWACAGFVTTGWWIKRVCFHVEQSEHSEQSILTVWGPGAHSRAPGGVQGQRPSGGPGGQSPRKLLGYQGFKESKNASHSFSFICKTSFAVKSVDIAAYSRPLWYKMI